MKGKARQYAGTEADVFGLPIAAKHLSYSTGLNFCTRATTAGASSARFGLTSFSLVKYSLNKSLCYRIPAQTEAYLACEPHKASHELGFHFYCSPRLIQPQGAWNTYPCTRPSGDAASDG